MTKMSIMTILIKKQFKYNKEGSNKINLFRVRIGYGKDYILNFILSLDVIDLMYITRYFQQIPSSIV